MINRRHFTTIAASAALLPLPAFAQSAQKAAAFVKETGDKLVAVVNGSGSAQQKRAMMTQIINSSVDVDRIGRFCLGRYWRLATPAQQKAYIDLFHEVLVTNITAKLGEYRGVTFTLGRPRTQDDMVIVSTTVNRPNSPPTAVDWVIANSSTDPKIVDVNAEGTSLRLTQRSDYASYLSSKGGNIDALIAAMKNQIQQNAG